MSALSRPNTFPTRNSCSRGTVVDVYDNDPSDNVNDST